MGRTYIRVAAWFTMLAITTIAGGYSEGTETAEKQETTVLATGIRIVGEKSEVPGVTYRNQTQFEAKLFPFAFPQWGGAPGDAVSHSQQVLPGVRRLGLESTDPVGQPDTPSASMEENEPLKIKHAPYGG